MLDATDRQLLALLQANAERKHTELADAVGLSPTAIHKRLKRLKDEGYIRKTVAVLDRQKLGLNLLCFIKVNFKNNMLMDNLSSLLEAANLLPEVLECYTLTGTTDALLKVTVPDQAGLRDFLRRLSATQTVIERSETCLVLEEFKEGHTLPLEPV